MLLFRGLFACHYSCIVLKRQTILTQFLLYGTTLSQIVLKYCGIWLKSVNPCLPKFWPQMTQPLLIWAMETFNGKLWPNGYRQCNGHNWESIGNHHCSFEWYHCWGLTTCPPPKWGPKCTSRTNFAMHAATWRIWWKISTRYYELSDLAFCLPNYFMAFVVLCLWLFLMSSKGTNCRKHSDVFKTRFRSLTLL